MPAVPPISTRALTCSRMRQGKVQAQPGPHRVADIRGSTPYLTHEVGAAAHGPGAGGGVPMTGRRPTRTTS